MGIRELRIVVLISSTAIQCDASTDDDRFAALEFNVKQQQVALNQTQQEIQNLKHQLAAQDSTSFFSAQFSSDARVVDGSTLIFDRVIANYGDDYLSSGGIYLAPEDGYYMFTFVMRENEDSLAAGSVMPNDVDMLCRAETGDAYWQTGTCTVITELSAGDQVTVVAGRLLGDDDNYYKADEYTSFTGLQARAGLE